MDATPKRGRGRPRKIKNTPPPEEIIYINTPGGEILDAPAQVDEEEVFHLAGDSSTPPDEPELVSDPEPIVTPTPVPPPEPTPQRAPEIVYLHADPPAVDEAKEKTRRHNVLTRIKKYRSSFEAVNAMRFSEDWPIETLESHLEDIRIMIGSKTTGLLVKSVYTMAVRGVEVGTTSLGMKTYGLCDLLSKNAEIDGILKELQCEMGVGHIPPHIRLGLATISTVFVLDSVNRRSEVLGNFKKESVNETIANKYGDL